MLLRSCQYQFAFGSRPTLRSSACSFPLLREGGGHVPIIFSVSCSQPFQCSAPRDHFVRHRMHSLVVLFVWLKGREVLEVRPHRKRHLRSHVRNLDFAHHEPQVLDCSDTTCTAISNKSRCFVIPFVIKEIDRVLQCRRCGMVVFGGDENEGVERGNFRAPSLRVRLAVLMHCRWHRLIEERQVVILDVYNLKLRVFTAFQDVVDPLCNGCGFPSWSRTTDDDSNFQHFLFLPSGAVSKYPSCEIERLLVCHASRINQTASLDSGLRCVIDKIIGEELFEDFELPLALNFLCVSAHN